MSGALKTVGKIAGVVGAVALIGSGIGAALGGTMLFTAFGASIAAGTIATIAGAVSVGASLLAGKGTPPALTDTTDRLNASIDPRTPRKLVFGSTAMATDIRDQEYTESQKYLHRWIVGASHKVHAIREIWFDDKLAWTLAGGPQGEFAPWLQVQIRTEGSAANAINISSRMGSSRRYTGCAYIYLRYQILAQSKKLDSVFNQSVPSRITIVGDGAFIYDPRKDSTVPGGSGSHRADDQSTWEWDADAARNPALQLLWYMLGWRINGLLAVGKGIPPARIDLESFAIAANICDEPVSIPGGGTEPRYRSDGVCSEGDSPTAVLDNLKATMNADLDDVGGKLRVTIFHNDLDSPVAAFTDDDVLGEFSWRPSVSLDDQFNIVRGTYIDPSNASLYQPNDYPQVEFPSPDGIDRVLPLDFPFIQSVNQPQRLANLRLQRQKIAGLFRAEFQATGWRAQKNAIVTLSFKPRGWVDKLFRVVELEHREDGVVPMLLREEHPDLYDPPAYGAGNEAVPPTPYDPALSPIVGAIARGAYTLRTREPLFPITGDDTSVIIAAFDGVLDDGTTVAFPAEALTASSSGVVYGLFYSLADEEYHLSPYPALPDMASSNNVFLGWQATSTAGEYPPQEPPPPGWGGNSTYPELVQQ